MFRTPKPRPSFVLLSPSHQFSDEPLTEEERRVIDRIKRYDPSENESFTEWLTYVHHLFTIENVTDDK